jgi:hypothetical protein
MGIVWALSLLGQHLFCAQQVVPLCEARHSYEQLRDH